MMKEEKTDLENIRQAVSHSVLEFKGHLSEIERHLTEMNSELSRVNQAVARNKPFRGYSYPPSYQKLQCSVERFEDTFKELPSIHFAIDKLIKQAQIKQNIIII